MIAKGIFFVVPVSVVPVKGDPVLVDLVLVVPVVTQTRTFVVMKFLRLSALVRAILEETGSLRFDVISGLIEHKCVFCLSQNFVIFYYGVRA